MASLPKSSILNRERLDCPTCFNKRCVELKLETLNGKDCLYKMKCRFCNFETDWDSLDHIEEDYTCDWSNV